MGVVDFTRINKMLNAAKEISEVAAWRFSMDNDVQEEIIRMNTIDQLYEEGIDSLNRPIGDYSPVTVMFKRETGQRYDHVTLNDEGDFYRSWSVEISDDSFTIDADDTGKYDVPLFDVWGVDVLGLTDENMEWLKKMILEKYIEYVRRQLLS